MIKREGYDDNGALGPLAPSARWIPSGGDYGRRLRWLMLCRSMFVFLMLGAALVYRTAENISYFADPLTSLYEVAGFVFFVNLFYLGIFRWFQYEIAFGGVQIVVDLLIVSAITYFTGLVYSPFLFLYPIVIICGTIYLGRSGGYFIAAMACIAFGFLVDLQFYGVLVPPGFNVSPFVDEWGWQPVFYRTSVMFLACLITALVSGYIAHQERRARADLLMLETQVKRVEKMAIIGEMAAGLAHEIKNPLASLSGSIQMLKGEARWESHHEKLMEIAVREAGRLSSLVTEFLLFARPGAGHPVPIFLAQAVEETVAFLAQDPKMGGQIHVKSVVGASLCVYMDAGHLRQILLNLLLNALEATDPRGTIYLFGYMDSPKGVMLSVKDGGPGIREADMAQIFDPFFTTKKEGTGLGLSIVFRLLQECGGGVHVTSPPGEGAEFIISLPPGGGH